MVVVDFIQANRYGVWSITLPCFTHSCKNSSATIGSLYFNALVTLFVPTSTSVVVAIKKFTALLTVSENTPPLVSTFSCRALRTTE